MKTMFKRDLKDAAEVSFAATHTIIQLGAKNHEN